MEASICNCCNSCCCVCSFNLIQLNGKQTHRFLFIIFRSAFHFPSAFISHAFHLQIFTLVKQFLERAEFSLISYSLTQIRLLIVIYTFFLQLLEHFSLHYTLFSSHLTCQSFFSIICHNSAFSHYTFSFLFRDYFKRSLNCFFILVCTRLLTQSFYQVPLQPFTDIISKQFQ